MIRVLMVDDHASSRESLAYLLERERDISVVAEASSVAEALGLLEDIDVAIVDLKLPDGSGVDIVGKLRESNRDAAVLCLTASDDEIDLALAVEAGAAAVLHKSVSTRDVVRAIRRLYAGEAVHSAEEVVRLFRVASERRKQAEFAEKALSLLTSREREVLQALAWGMSDKEIAEFLNIGARTARSHVANILGKLQVESRLQAVILAMSYGVVSHGSSISESAGVWVRNLSRGTYGNSNEV